MADKISAPIKQYPKEKGTPGPPHPKARIILISISTQKGI